VGELAWAALVMVAPASVMAVFAGWSAARLRSPIPVVQAAGDLAVVAIVGFVMATVVAIARGSGPWPLLGVAAATALLIRMVRLKVALADRALERARALLDDAGAIEHRTVSGRRGGAALTFELQTRLRSNARGGPAGEIRYTALRGTGDRADFVLRLERETLWRRFLAWRGRRIDVVTGDPAFDRRYIVEAAPSDIARALLDAETRARLLEHRPLELRVERGTLWMRCREWRTSERAVADLVAVAARLVGEVADTYADENRRLTASVGGAYRPAIDATALRQRVGARQRELERLGALDDARLRRRRRRHRVATMVVLMIAAVVGTAVGGIVLAALVNAIIN
jgi:hypothetical protein